MALTALRREDALRAFLSIAAVCGKRRCRMHGGKSTGPPKGSQNALKHGRYTAKAILGRRQTLQILLNLQEFIRLA